MLVVDQFEELFTQPDVEVDPFIQALLKLVEIPNVYLILTVRADFYPDLMETLLWENIRSHRFEVLPLKGRRLRQAIIKPSEGVKVYIETALVERLVIEAEGEAVALPLIQETLVLLWEKLERRFLSLRAYNFLIENYSNKYIDRKKSTGLEIAIANQADATLAYLGKEEQSIVRRIFMRLIHFGEGRADTRRQQTVEQLMALDDEPELFNSTLLHLADRRLLTLSGEADEVKKKVDIAHEALIEGWPTLSSWLSERKEAEVIRRKLMRRVEDWIGFGKSKNRGLLDEAQLIEAKRWLNSQDSIDLGHDKSLLELVKISEHAINQNLEYKRLLLTKAQRRAKIAIVLALTACTTAVSFLVQLSQTLQSEINSLTALSIAYHAENKKPEALVSSIKAVQKLKSPLFQIQHNLHLLSDTTRNKAIASLAKSVYEIRELNRLEGHSAPIKSISFSPNGQFIASASDDYFIIVWNINGKIVNNWIADASRVTSLDFSPVKGENQIVSGSMDGTVTLWNLNGKPEWKNKYHNLPIKSVRFSNNGKKIAVTSDDGTISIIDKKNSTKLESLKSHNDTVSSAIFSPIENIIASASLDKTVKIWDLSNRQNETTLKHSSLVNSVEFSPTGKVIATGSEDGKIRFWSKEGKNLLDIADHKAPVNDIKFISENQIASAGNDKSIKLWSINRQDNTFTSKLIDTLKGHTGVISSLSTSKSKNRRILASAGNDNTIKFWNLERNPYLKILEGHTSPVRQLSFSPDSRYLATVSLGENAIIWKLVGDTYINQKKLTGYHKLDFLPKSGSPAIALASSDNMIKLWNLEQNKVTKIIGEHSDVIHSIKFSTNNSMLASTSWDRTLKIWSMKSETISNLFELKNNQYTHIDFSSDSKKIALATEDKSLQIWNFQQNQLTPVGSHKETIRDISFSPDNKKIASASNDNTVQLWSIDRERERSILSHEGNVTSVDFSTSGDVIISASNNKIHLWNREGQELIRFESIEDTFIDADFSPDGRNVVAASKDSRVVIWNLELENLLNQGCDWLANFNQNKSNSTSIDYSICK